MISLFFDRKNQLQIAWLAPRLWHGRRWCCIFLPWRQQDLPRGHGLVVRSLFPIMMRHVYDHFIMKVYSIMIVWWRRIILLLFPIIQHWGVSIFPNINLPISPHIFGSPTTEVRWTDSCSHLMAPHRQAKGARTASARCDTASWCRKPPILWRFVG